jgi:hypothetical protein
MNGAPFRLEAILFCPCLELLVNLFKLRFEQVAVAFEHHWRGNHANIGIDLCCRQDVKPDKMGVELTGQRTGGIKQQLGPARII